MTSAAQVFGLLVNSGQPALWLDAEPRGPWPQLPESLGRAWVRPQLKHMQGFAEFFGGPVHNLCCLEFAAAKAEQETPERSVFALEWLSKEAPKAPGQWLGPEQISKREDGPRLLSFLNRITSTKQPAWSQRSWFTQATDWMRTQLQENGLALKSEPEAYSSWGVSALIRAETEQGRVYFKAAPELGLFANEAAVTQTLAQLFPGQTPQPLAVDSGQRWLLLRDFGEDQEEMSPERHARMLSDFARLQIAAQPQTKALLAGGCVDRQLESMPAALDAFLRDAGALSGLNDHQRSLLRQAQPRLIEHCQALMASDIGQSLVHADLHMGNVLQRPEGSFFFDWSWGCVSHPFFDLALMHCGCQAPEPELLDAYFQPWREHSSAAAVADAWRHAKPLALLFQALGYWPFFKDVDEPTRTAFRDPVGHFLRPLIEILESSDHEH